MLRFSCYKSWRQGAGIEPPYWSDAGPCSRILNGLGDDAMKLAFRGPRSGRLTYIRLATTSISIAVYVYTWG
jgi:hypothetical protein